MVLFLDRTHLGRRSAGPYGVRIHGRRPLPAPRAEGRDLRPDRKRPDRSRAVCDRQFGQGRSHARRSADAQGRLCAVDVPRRRRRFVVPRHGREGHRGAEPLGVASRKRLRSGLLLGQQAQQGGDLRRPSGQRRSPSTDRVITSAGTATTSKRPTRTTRCPSPAATSGGGTPTATRRC